MRDEPFVYGEHPHTEKLKDLLQRQLNETRVAALDGKLISPLTGQLDYEYHLRIADAITEKYVGKNDSLKAELFIDLKPNSWLANEKPSAHATTITDNFTRADGTTIGNLLTWTEIQNDLATVSNAVRNNGSGTNNIARGRAESDLSSSDNYSQGVLNPGSNTGRGAGLSCRLNGSNQECYEVQVFGGTGANVWGLNKVNSAGTRTLIGANPTATYSTNAKVQANGSTISTYNNGVLVESLTDTTYATGTRCGITVTARNTADVPSVDDFAAGDLTVGLKYSQLERSIRGLNRGLCFGMR